MHSPDNNFSLDDTAKELYAQLAGLDTSPRVLTDGQQGGSALIDLLGEEEKWLDHYRLLLADAVAHLADLLHKSTLLGFAGEQQACMDSLHASLKKFSRFPKFDGRIIIRLQGRLLPTEKEGSQVYDYELAAGNLLLDLQVARIVGKRRGPASANLYSQLSKAFKAFSTLGINILNLDTGMGTAQESATLAETLELLGRYFRETRSGQTTDFIVNDEYGLANANLTLLAAVNRVKPDTVRNLIKKISPMMFGEQSQKELDGFVTVYDALFAFKKIREQLKKPPVELNNIQRMLPRQGEKERDTGQTKVSRLVIAKFGATPSVSAQVMASVSSDGYRSIYSGTLQSRLSLANDFLKLAENDSDKMVLTQTALGNINKGLEMVSDEVFDEIEIEGHDLRTLDSIGKPVSRRLHEELAGLLHFFKRRTTIKKKMREMSRRQIDFDDQDYAVIARNFSITEKEAAHLVALLKNCFDGNGRFRRSAFEKNLPDFVQYESKVFEFLWHYLKELIVREDRVSFLNALQHLFSRLPHPRAALHILLQDIFHHSDHPSFSDRNGLILANILLRKYNQELGSHIELTPEEVLQVREGLDREMADTAVRFIEEEREDVFRKFRIIHEELQKTVSGADSGQKTMPLRYLTTLERELIIFLSLIGGENAHKIIRSAAKEYGNPNAAIYSAPAQVEHIRSFLQLLQVTLRALRRFSSPEDLPFFQIVNNRAGQFLAMRSDAEHAKLVKRVISWAE